MQHSFQNLLIIGIACFAIGTTTTLGQLQSNQVTIEVEGLACPFCVQGLEKQLRQVEGVESVQTALGEGRAVLTLQPGKKVSDEDLREAVRRAGFRAGKITREEGEESNAQDQRQFTGQIVEAEDHGLALKASDGKTYLLYQDDRLFQSVEEPAPLLKRETETRLREMMKQNATVAVTGSVHHHVDMPPGLQVNNVEIASR